jgi:hypothetical protein
MASTLSLAEWSLAWTWWHAWHRYTLTWGLGLKFGFGDAGGGANVCGGTPVAGMLLMPRGKGMLALGLCACWELQLAAGRPQPCLWRVESGLDVVARLAQVCFTVGGGLRVWGWGPGMGAMWNGEWWHRP